MTLRLPASLLLSGPLLLAGPLLCAPARAAGDVLLVIAVDDRDGRLLAAPRLVIGAQGAGAARELALADDGSRVGDVPGDGIWMGAQALAAEGSAQVELRDGEVAYPGLALVLPAGERVYYAYKLRPDGSLAPDPGARAVDRVGDPVGGAGDPLVVAAAPVTSASARTDLGDDQVLVRVAVDDRAVRRLRAPGLRVSQDGVEPVSLRDDGGVEGDVAGDGTWMAEVVVRRTQYLTLAVEDGGAALADVTVFLPSSGQAAIGLRTTEGAPGVELSAEAVATSATASPTGTSSTGDSGAGDRLAYVLWTLIGLFSVAFAWVRAVAWRAWRDEVRPVLQRLERHLDAVEEAGRREQDPGPPGRGETQ